MDRYEVDQSPFYASPDGKVSAFNGRSRERDNRPIIIIRHDLEAEAYKDRLPEILNANLNSGLEQARGEHHSPFKLLDIQLDLRHSPKNYTVFLSLETAKPQGDDGATLWATLYEKSTQTEAAKARYRIKGEPIYHNPTTFVKIFKGELLAFDLPVIIKRQEFFLEQYGSDLPMNIAKAIKAGLIQARVEHPNTCQILEMHLDIREAPGKYCLDHVLEALERDVGEEIKLRSKGQKRYMSESELWGFIVQTASSLAYAHSKVRNT